jgi:hypothetical protein
MATSITNVRTQYDVLEESHGEGNRGSRFSLGKTSGRFWLRLATQYAPLFMSSSTLKTVSPLCLMCLFDMPAISALQDGKRAGIEEEELECPSGSHVISTQGS